MIASLDLDRRKALKTLCGDNAAPRQERPTAALNANWRRLSFGDVAEHLSAGRLQAHAKAIVGRSDDPLELEADRIAESLTGTSLAGGIHSAEAGAGSRSSEATSADGLTTGGTPLPPAVRSYFEPRFGRDLSAVRVHSGLRAEQENDRLGARAFTLGRDIWLGRGESPTASPLLAHELAHVAQDDVAGGATPDMIRRKEDWDFTPADLGTLTKGGGKLTFDADSAWFPDAFKKNLLTTLDTLLDPKRKVAATAGVNVRDFYHGHVGIKGARPSDLRKLMTAARSAEESEYTKALGKSFADVTQANLPAFRKAVTAALPRATALLEATAKLKDVVVIYHTYESNMPSGMKAGSPTRNFITPLGGTTSPYSPPDIGNASSWMDEFSSVYQFSFLIDEKGAIHVRPSSVRELSTVTGKPETL
jgi:hypothetical protein